MSRGRTPLLKRHSWVSKSGMSPTKAGRHVFVIGHRGAASQAPENTMPSFVRAMKAGADFIEMDVRRTRDSVLVILHDDTVDRTTDSTGQVSEFTLSELRGMDAGSWYSAAFKGTKIPTLEEVLDIANARISVAVEVKVPGVEGDIVNILTRYHMMHDSMILVGNNEQVARNVRTIEPSASIQGDVNFSDRTPDKEKLEASIDKLLSSSVNIASVHKSNPALRELVGVCHRRGLLVNAWPVNETCEILKCLELGVDFLTTDNPELAIAMLRKEGFSG